MNVFKKGFEAREEEVKTKKSGFLKDYFLTAKDNPDAPIRFLTDEPVSFWGHNVQEGNRFVTYACTCEPDCPLCQSGAPRSYKSAFLVADGRHQSYVNKKGEKVEYDLAVSVLLRGNDVGIIERNKQRYGLLNSPFYATRMGVKPAITYLFDKAGEEIFERYPYLDRDVFAVGELNEDAKQKIKELLPDSCKDLSYYEVIETKFPFYGQGKSDTFFDTTEFVEPIIKESSLRNVARSIIREVD